MRKITLLLLLTSSLVSADSSSQDLNPDTYLDIFRTVTHEENVEISDKGNYLLVTTKESRIYVFTKPTHPGYPGYIEWEISVENGQTRLDAKGVHGENEREFHIFESEMNKVMSSYLKGKISEN